MNRVAHSSEAFSHRMRVMRQHRLDAVPRDLSKISVVYAGDA
jgi:hypothetical protein